MNGRLWFSICYGAPPAPGGGPSQVLLYLMVVSQELLRYAMTASMGPVVVDIFKGPHAVGLITVAEVGGATVGSLAAGLADDVTGSHRDAFIGSIMLCVVSAGAVWNAAPGKMPLVPERVRS